MRPGNFGIQHFLADIEPEGMTDGELLARFLSSRDDNALAALVHRHAPMVWGVCCRQLNRHDAEDAFQATFLVLVRRAADVPSQAVANWLYGVARMTAVSLRASMAKRGRRETQVVDMPEPTVPEVRDADLQLALDEELSSLPDHYRAVIILCDLEARSRREVAAHLGCPEGTVASRLVRARSMLAKRLTQRGVVLTGVELVGAHSLNIASAGVPISVVSSTINAASLCGQVSLKVAALTEGVLKTMLLTKLKSVMAVLVIAAMVGLIGYGIARGQQKGVQKQEPKAQKDAIVKEK